MIGTGDVYVVPFQGEVIECQTGLDAVAVKMADRVLAGRDDATPVEMQRIAAVFERYGREDVAQRLRNEAGRTRAAELFGK